jgi:hypothetical protein
MWRRPIRSSVSPLLSRVISACTLAAAAGCGGSGPASPSQPPLPVVSESASFRYHHASGDAVDADWQEAYHTWAIATLGVQIPQKIEYYKYRSRQDMGDHTGNYNTNGFAEPARFEIHTLWPTDNHEVVHIYTALVGRPSDFFNEGIAVAMQTNPPAGNLEAFFNGQQVHEACRQYLQFGTLVVPLDRAIQTDSFRAITDQVLSYREAGSFVRFVIDTYGMPPVREFFRNSNRGDDLATIKQRFNAAFGVPFDAAESAWMSMLRNP